MNRFLLVILLCATTVVAVAQERAPRWMAKSRNAMLLVTAFDSNGKVLRTGTAFFVSADGEAVASYSLFEDAASAEAKSSDGRSTYKVDRVLGADNMYDVIRFKVEVSRPVVFLPIANENVAVDEKVYMMQFSTDRVQPFTVGTILETSTFNGPFAYYKVSFPISGYEVNSPLILSTGEVIGLAQEDASGQSENSYAVSATYANSLNFNLIDHIGKAYSFIQIKKAWPSDVNEADFVLQNAASELDIDKYLEVVNDFISVFPNSPEGYSSRAMYYMLIESLSKAMDDITTAINRSEEKEEMYYRKANMIFSAVVEDSTITEVGWSSDAALEAVNQAITIKDNALYRLLQGHIFFYMQDYNAAYASYAVVNDSDMASFESYTHSVEALVRTTGFNIGDVIDLLDKAIASTGYSPTLAAAPLVLERAEWRSRLALHDEEVKDYDLYYDIVRGDVNAIFFYFRHQAKIKAGDMNGALEDIQQAIALEPEADYLAEEASLFIRMDEYEKALQSLNKALEINPDFGACYRLKGVCLLRLNRAAEACEAFSKAKELGDPVVDRLIKDNCE
jgi:Trypsin-like serine proteases, typically periplasmic, contain C-terminal PDZ domain